MEGGKEGGGREGGRERREEGSTRLYAIIAAAPISVNCIPHIVPA